MGQTKIPEQLYPCFEAAGSLRRYAPGETIYLQGEDANRLYFIRQGRVRVFCVTNSGRELTFEIIEKGRIFGESSFLAHSARPVSVAAVNQVELLACRLDQLYAAAGGSQELTGFLLRHLSDTCNHLTEQLRRIALYDRYQKLASFLLSETCSPDPDRGVTGQAIPYTQEDLALALGMNRVTVNRVLNEWKAQGILALSYGRILITDRDALRACLRRAP
ncbi:MAG TPA: Crp/Fnr family transcriptional regulator [Candidatus Caccousia avistercoris]|nr:Crp/Fnr family transcriptional regulator [Candidatus Caccousia avistercoris]